MASEAKDLPDLQDVEMLFKTSLLSTQLDTSASTLPPIAVTGFTGAQYFSDENPHGLFHTWSGGIYPKNMTPRSPCSGSRSEQTASSLISHMPSHRYTIPPMQRGFRTARLCRPSKTAVVKLPSHKARPGDHKSWPPRLSHSMTSLNERLHSSG